MSWIMEPAEAAGDPAQPDSHETGPGSAEHQNQAGRAADQNFVVVASRLPVDRVEEPDGGTSWRRSPGGLVTALEPVMREAGGAWIGWTGDAGPAPGPVEAHRPPLVGAGPSPAGGRGDFPRLCHA